MADIFLGESSTPERLDAHPFVDASNPSLNDPSATVILATLADSRPSTSHGVEEEEEELEDDDDQDGGILLADESQGVVTAIPFTMAAPGHMDYSNIGQVMHGQVMHQSGNYLYYEMDSSSYEALDQHAVALESLSMEPLQLLSSTASSSTPDQIMTLAPINQHEPDMETGLYDEHLSVQNKETFMNITSFFDHFIAPRKPISSSLDETRLPDAITRDDLQGDRYDFQGIDWTSRHCTRAFVRERREAFETARIQVKTRALREWRARTPNTENFFSFRRMNTAHRPFIPHFQLRNLLATTSRNDIYYAARHKVMHTDASGSPATAVMDLSKQVTDGQRFQVTTLSALDDVLIAGGFEGEYALTSLSATYGTPLALGRIKDRSPESKSHITNHIHMFESRSNYTPQAVLCSNDYRLRILDCGTNTFTHSYSYPTAVNCSATSPDGRMRVVVGDFSETLITNAETGQPFESLNSHTDDVFACAWADDGIHVATAAQDSTIVVWDARYWGNPLTVMDSELSVPRVLRFSPVGSGPRVLVAAESDDYISIINAQNFETRQVFDFFGSTAGISMTPDGQSLFVANSEKRFAGIMELERAGWSDKRVAKRWEDDWMKEEIMVDWAKEDVLREDKRVVCGWDERERRGVGLGELCV